MTVNEWADCACEKTGMKLRTTRVYRNELLKNGFVQREGNTKTGQWSITEIGKQALQRRGMAAVSLSVLKTNGAHKK